VQTLAVLEVGHAALGVVRSPPGTTALQVASRLFVVWGVLRTSPAAPLARVGPLGLETLAGAWGATEVVRYSFYAAKGAPGAGGPALRALTALRYSLFLVLYPLGVASEAALLWRSLPAAAAGALSLRMPNALNLAVDFHALCWAALAAYPPGFYSLFSHMLRQRRRALGGGAGRSGRGTERPGAGAGAEAGGRGRLSPPRD